MNVAVDLGNTFSKIGLFEGQSLLKEHSRSSDADIVELIHDLHPENVVVGSVGREVTFIEKACLADNINCLVVNSSVKLPVHNHYKTQETLGVDRLAAIAGATEKFPGKNCLAIDLGTCITYDLADGESNYLGGSISPGLHMRFKALHTFTARLPLVEVPQNISGTEGNKGLTALAGRTTEESILSGIVHGTAAEIEGMIKKYARNRKDLQVVICGGDAKFFESKIKAPIFVIPELVLIGLNRILQHNVSNN